jgi:hypothetical protein
MKRAPNLDQGNPDAKAKNSPSPLPKQKRTNLARTAPMAKARNTPAPYGKNSESQTMRVTPTNVPPRDMPHDERIQRELTTGKRSNSHSRSGR